MFHDVWALYNVGSYVSKCGSVGIACMVILETYVQFEDKLILNKIK